MLSILAALMLGMVLGPFNGALVAFRRLAAVYRHARYLYDYGAAYLLADGTTALTPTSASSGSAITTWPDRGWW